MAAILSILVLGIFASLAGAWAMLRRGRRRQAILLLVLALAMAGNVAIWVMPTTGGSAPIGHEPG